MLLSFDVDITLNGYVRNEQGACFRGFARGDISLDIVTRERTRYGFQGDRCQVLMVIDLYV
jgi:hypothetical protein